MIAFGVAEMFFRFYEPVELRLRGNKINLATNELYVYGNSTMPKLAGNILHVKNSIGFRGANPPSDFDSRLTILSAGGSTTESYFISEGATWTDQLGLRLKKVFKPMWINNAGLDGHSSFGHLILLKDHILRLKPKMILFLVGINDQKLDKILPNDAELLEDSSGEARLSAKESPSTLKMLWQSMTEKSDVLAFAQNFFRYSQAVMRAHTAPMGHMQPTQLKKESRIIPEDRKRALQQEHARFLKSYEERLVRLIRLSQDNGIEPVLITQTRFGGGEQWVELEFYNEVTRQVARAFNVFLVDLGQTLADDPAYYYDFIHYTEAGSEAVAKVVHQQLCPYLETHYDNYLVEGYSCEKPSKTVQESSSDTYDTMEVFHKAVKRHPDVPDTYLARGMVYWAYYNEYELALEDFEKVLSLDETRVGVRFWKGLSHYDLKQYPEAIAELSAVLAANPGSADAYRYRAMAYGHLKQIQPSIADFTKAIALIPNKGDLHYQRALMLVQSNRHAEAIEDFNISLRFPSYVPPSQSHFNRGGAYFMLNRFPEAIADYSKAIQLQPDYKLAYLMRGLSYLKLGDTAKGCNEVKSNCTQQTCGPDIVAFVASKQC